MRLPIYWLVLPWCVGGCSDANAPRCEYNCTAVSAAPGEVYKERDPDEWQGRLQRIDVHEACNDYGSCGRARACFPDGLCGPCNVDADCLTDEACVLDNCIPADRVFCRTRDDCEPDDLCVIERESPYVATWRGNYTLISGCSNSDRIRAVRAGMSVSEDDL
jgi:hypothetical protein